MRERLQPFTSVVITQLFSILSSGCNRLLNAINIVDVTTVFERTTTNQQAEFCVDANFLDI